MLMKKQNNAATLCFMTHRKESVWQPGPRSSTWCIVGRPCITTCCGRIGVCSVFLACRWLETASPACGTGLYGSWVEWCRCCFMKLQMSSDFYFNRATEREFSRDYSYITQAVSVCDEVELSCPSRWIDVFSDTAVITFPPDGFGSLPQCTWAEPPEPQYRHCPDLEIIQRGTELREEVNWHM